MTENGTSWTVTRQRPESSWVDGQYLDGIRVFFDTGAGQSDSVWVSNNDYSASRVRSAIAARAAIVDEVAGLTGG